MPKLLICYGTRPEEIKLRPIIQELKKRSGHIVVVRVLQHDTLLSSEDFVDFDVPIHSNTGNRLNDILCSILSNKLFSRQLDDCTHVMVQGDTATALACAMAAFNHGKKVIHVEAGLRSYDTENPWPEESYRRMISAMASIHFCPTELNKNNLVFDERLEVSSEMFVVGNSVLDNLHGITPSYSNMVLCTMHRRENKHKKEWFEALDAIARIRTDEHYILISHPSVPKELYHSLQYVSVIEPLPYHEFLHLLAKARCIVTDSGGLQEEGSFFQKKIVVCRESTERREAIKSGHAELCILPELLEAVLKPIVNDPYINSPCPFGDGRTSQKIADILENEGIL